MEDLNELQGSERIMNKREFTEKALLALRNMGYNTYHLEDLAIESCCQILMVDYWEALYKITAAVWEFYMQHNKFPQIKLQGTQLLLYP